MTQYQSYNWLYPPRATNAIPLGLLAIYEKWGWWCQIKKNGTNSVIFVPPSGEIIAKSRTGEDHKAWSFSVGSRAIFERLRTRGWSVYNAELMHSKGFGFRDTHYVHDVLVYDGELLDGTAYADRYELLTRLFRGKDETHSHVIVDEHTWLAKNHTSDFRGLFAKLIDEDEGLVLKNPEGLFSVSDNSSWSVKCRRPHKNYPF